MQAAQEALADRAPARLQTATKRLKNMNFVRHYLMEDGTYWGSNFGNRNQQFLNHAAESDPRLLLVQFAREEKKDIVLMNWQAHNDQARAAGFYMLSSSYTGRVRAKFEAETGMHFAFFQGASGNQNPGSFIEKEHHGLVFIPYGEKLAEYAIEALQEMKPVEGTQIVTTRRVFEAPADHSLDSKREEGEEVLRIWEKEGIEAARALAKTYGFTSFHAIGSIVRKCNQGATVSIVLNAFRIGRDLVLTDDQKNIVLEAVNNALKEPLKLTPSQYTEKAN